MTAKKYRIKKFPGVYGYDSASRRSGGKADVCYYIVITVDGKNITEKIGWASEGYTPQFASEFRAKRIRDARHLGEIKTSKEAREEFRKSNRPIGAIMKHYFDSTHGMLLKGRKTDLSRWKHHLAFLEEKSVKDLTQVHIERIRRDMMERKLSPATINHALRLLRRFINYGAAHNLCPALPFKIKFQKVNNTLTEYLTPEEASRLLETLDTWPRQDIARMVKLAMFSGMRRGELFKLKQEDIDFEHGFLTITNPKGGKDATIPMSPPVRELLEQQIAYLKREQKLRERRYRNSSQPQPPWEEHGYVFPGIHGKQRQDCGAIDRIKAAANLPHSFRPFHGLRHHYAVLLASSGEFNLDQIGQLLTHKSSEVTRRYAHFLPEAQKQAANRAAEIIADQAKKP